MRHPLLAPLHRIGRQAHTLPPYHRFTEELEKASDAEQWRKRERELARRIRVLDYSIARLFAQREERKKAQRDREPTAEAVARKEASLGRQIRAVQRRRGEGRRCVSVMREQAAEGKEQLTDLRRRWRKLTADLDVCKRGGVIDVPLSQVRAEVEEERLRLQREVTVREKYHEHVLARMQLDVDEKAEEVREAQQHVEQAKAELAAKRRAKRQAKAEVESWEALQSALTHRQAAQGGARGEADGEAGAGGNDEDAIRQIPSTRQLLALTARSRYQSGGVSMRQMVWGAKGAKGAAAGASKPSDAGDQGTSARLGGLAAVWGVGRGKGAATTAAEDTASPARVGKSSMTSLLYQKQTVQALRGQGASGQDLQLAEGEVDEYVDYDDSASSASEGEMPLV